MHYSPFGTTGIRVSQIALGTGTLGKNRAGQIDRSQAEGIVNAYLEAGGNFIDTSDAYLGESRRKRSDSSCTNGAKTPWFTPRLPWRIHFTRFCVLELPSLNLPA
jgi:Aldo/keto reductase family